MVYHYSVVVHNFDEAQWTKRLEAKRYGSKKANSEYNSESYKKDWTINEKKIKTYQVFEEINKTIEAGKLEQLEKTLFIIKNGNLIEVTGLLRYHPEMKREDFDKVVQTEFEGFFNSLEIA